MLTYKPAPSILSASQSNALSININFNICGAGYILVLVCLATYVHYRREQKK
jgi:hypothetical protein